MRNWVLLRGLIRESRHWGEFALQLQAHYPDDQIICLDWPGNGIRYQEKSFDAIADMAGYCQQSLDQYGLPGPYHIVAVSLGAMAALEWAHQRPEQIASCTLINTSLRQFSPIHHRLAWRRWPALVRLLILSTTEREAHILALTSNTANASTIASWQSYAAQNPVSKANLFRQLWAASQYHSPAQAPAVPLLLLNSLGDELVAPQCSQAIANAWHCPLRTHPSAGHDLPLDAPQWVIEQIDNTFFKKTESPQQNIALSCSNAND